MTRAGRAEESVRGGTVVAAVAAVVAAAWAAAVRVSLLL